VASGFFRGLAGLSVEVVDGCFNYAPDILHFDYFGDLELEAVCGFDFRKQLGERQGCPSGDVGRPHGLRYCQLGVGEYFSRYGLYGFPDFVLVDVAHDVYCLVLLWCLYECVAVASLRDGVLGKGERRREGVGDVCGGGFAEDAEAVDVVRQFFVASGKAFCLELDDVSGNGAEGGSGKVLWVI